MKKGIIRFLVTALFAGSTLSLAATPDSVDPFAEAHDIYHKFLSEIYPNGLAPISPEDSDAQAQLDQLHYLFSRESLPEWARDFQDRVHEKLGSIMFVGGTILQQSFSGCRNEEKNGAPAFVNWARLAIAQAANVMVDGMPVTSSFFFGYPPEIKIRLYPKDVYVGYGESVLQTCLERLVNQRRIFACNLGEISASYSEKFQTVLLDGSVNYIMPSDEIAAGAMRFTQPGGRVIVPMTEGKQKPGCPLNTQFDPLQEAFSKIGFRFVEFVGINECKPYETYGKNGANDVAVELPTPPRSPDESFLHALGGHLLAQFNMNWGLAVWERIADEVDAAAE